VYVYVQIYTCIYIYTYWYCIYTYVLICLYMYIGIYVRIVMLMCVYMYTSIVYVYTHYCVATECIRGRSPCCDKVSTPSERPRTQASYCHLQNSLSIMSTNFRCAVHQFVSQLTLTKESCTSAKSPISAKEPSCVSFCFATKYMRNNNLCVHHYQMLASCSWVLFLRARVHWTGTQAPPYLIPSSSTPYLRIIAMHVLCASEACAVDSRCLRLFVFSLKANNIKDNNQ